MHLWINVELIQFVIIKKINSEVIINYIWDKNSETQNQNLESILKSGNVVYMCVVYTSVENSNTNTQITRRMRVMWITPQ